MRNLHRFNQNILKFHDEAQHPIQDTEKTLYVHCLKFDADHKPSGRSVYRLDTFEKVPLWHVWADPQPVCTLDSAPRD